ncbi:MAG: T9SS type A sorting domain-containing protein [Flavobacteriia bacterium]|nr:T9SS type A sorting domain-containing protein [Flavobacteriia bacterium]OJX36911.1 MAG: hypothetical protein BGO87_14095 [Flavobacteriia bacterium 40-80]
MRTYIALLFTFLIGSGFSQQLTRGEYFFDHDPGIGNGNTFMLSNTATISESINISTASLSAGFHSLSIRVKNNLGRWSHYENKSFYVLVIPVGSPLTNVVAGEYFLDTDPGIGNGMPFTLTPGTNFSGTINLPITSVNKGFHNLFIRVKDNLGRWSHYESKSFYVLDSSGGQAAADVVAGEWFLETDPGTGNGTPFTLTAGTSFSGIIDLSITGLSGGFHNMFIRVKDNLGHWSHYESKSFYVLDNSGSQAAADLVAGEWFLENDPGIGNATPFTLTAGTSFSGIIDLSTTGLNAGFHSLFIRVKDNLGSWSHYENQQFYVLSDPGSQVTADLVTGEWFLENDPGIGNAMPFTLTAGTGFSGIISVPTTGLNTGFHNLFIRVKDNLGRWSHYESALFYILENPGNSTTTNLISGEWFIDSDPGIENGTSFSLIPGTNFSGMISVPTTTLSEGFHLLYARVKEDQGRWSHYESAAFFILSASQGTTSTNFLKGEYFFDSDPGAGNGIAFAVPAQTSISNLPLALDVSSLSDGDHRIHIRLQDENRKWSHYETRNFYICGDLIGNPSYTGTTVFCQGNQINITGIPVNNISSVFWTGPNGYRLQSLVLVRNNATPAMSGEYRFHVVSEGGYHCDTNSIAVNVVVNPSFNNYQQVTLCHGDTLTIGNNHYTSAGFYTTTLQTTKGCDSIISTSLNVLPENKKDQVIQLCAGEAYSIGGHIYTTNGTYIDTLTDTKGCDSVVTTHLSIGNPVISTQITFIDSLLIAEAANVSYQWLDCENDLLPISGATNKQFHLMKNGVYAVRLTSLDCPDVSITSNCFEVNNLKISSQQAFGKVKVYPNPNNGLVYVETDDFNGIEIKITDIQGRLLNTLTMNEIKTRISLEEYAAGTYILKLKKGDLHNLYKIIKE